MQKSPSVSASSIAYFGEEGSFSHLAAYRRFPKATLVSCPTVEGCFAALVAEKFSQIIVPIENASSGMITNTVDQLIALAEEQNPNLEIREALAMPVKLLLLAGRARGPIKKIYSHPAPLTHARNWLRKNYPDAALIPVVSTSEAARKIRDTPGSAAIAGEQAARLYKLQIVRDDVGAEIANQTTFFIVGLKLAHSRPATHSTIIFEGAHKPGTLASVLQALARQKLNLTRIESRPIPGRFSEYRFMIEFEGNPTQARFRRALKNLKRYTHSCEVLGSYPVLKI